MLKTVNVLNEVGIHLSAIRAGKKTLKEQVGGQAIGLGANRRADFAET